MDNKTIQFIWISVVFLILALACNTLTSFGEDYEEVRSTAQSIATQAQEMITQAQGIVTEIGESDSVATAQAIATQEGPSLIATGEALATQAAEGGYLETVVAFVTQESGDLLVTLQAIATEGFIPGEQPDDIPLLAAEARSEYFANDSIVSYVATIDLPTTIDFYKTSMPFNGWESIPDGTSEMDSAAILRYAKADRLATVTLTASPLTRQTVVLITITPR